MAPELTRFQISVHKALTELLERRGASDLRVREKVAGADEETGLPGERTLVVSFPFGKGRCEVWIYEDEVGLDVPGEEWLSFDGMEFGDERALEKGVIECVTELLDA